MKARQTIVVAVFLSLLLIPQHIPEDAKKGAGSRIDWCEVFSGSRECWTPLKVNETMADAIYESKEWCGNAIAERRESKAMEKLIQKSFAHNE